MNKDELKKRTKNFALKVMDLADALPKNTHGRIIGSQLLKSGTSVGSNYRSACRGRSKAEFIAKLGIVEEEADETAYWLELIIESNLMGKNKVVTLIQEANEIVAIMAASRKSAIKNRKSKSQI